MGLGDRISRWIATTPPFSYLINYIVDIEERLARLREVSRTFDDMNFLQELGNLFILPVVFVGYGLLGIDSFLGGYTAYIGAGNFGGYTNIVSAVARGLMGHERTGEILELMGTLVSEPLLALIDKYGGHDDFDNNAFLREFYGYLTTVPLIASGVSSLGEVVTGGLIKNLGKPIESSYWTLGLGFIGWQGVSPFLTESLLQASTRAAKKRFRPERFKVADLVKLSRLGYLGQSEYINQLAELGYRTSDYNNLSVLFRENLNLGQLRQFFEEGLITEEVFRDRVSQLGYTITDVNLITQASVKNMQEDIKQVSLGSARKAYKLHLITANELNAYLASLNYSAEAIRLEIAILEFDAEVESKELSVGQLKQAYSSNVINATELAGGLIELGYTPDNAAILIKTWKNELAPKVLKINQSSLRAAYLTGVITPNEYLVKLGDLGYSENDANLIIRTTDLQTRAKAKVPSDDKIMQALSFGLIDEQAALTSLTSRGYSQTDARLLVDIAQAKEVIRLKANDILNAFGRNIIEEGEAREKLQSVGADENYITVQIQNYAQRRAKAVKQPSPRDIALWYNQALIDKTRAYELFIASGYEPDNAQIFVDSLDLSIPRELSDRNIQDALGFGVISPDAALQAYKGIGLSDSDAQLRIETIVAQSQTFAPKVSVSALLTGARDGIITTDELAGKLASLGYSQEDILLYQRLAESRPRTENTKLTKEEIIKAAKQGLLDFYMAGGLLESKGYTIEEIVLLFALADVLPQS